MANKTINDFTAKTALATTDYYLIQEVGGTTKRVSAPNISSCGQLAFPATQNASSNANTLDDYEEGTFTPVIKGSTSEGTGTYTTQTGAYTKIGRLVNFALAVTITAHDGTGSMRIDGLPFSQGGSDSVYSLSFTGLPFSGAPVGALYSTTLFTVAVMAEDGTTAAVTLETDTAFTIRASGTYRS